MITADSSTTQRQDVP